MTRQEEISKEAKIYADNPDSSIIEHISDEMGFRAGAEWADEHPKKGFVNKEKVEQWIIGCFEFLNDAGNHKFKIDMFINNFRKAMEE